ncbi:APC family permease [Pseudoglutamicibacter cumminsii]|uniref:Amino acid permease n=1 Tax=Pseudoglutamicibacter cumminsii TaxID=156979 RepID=A0ABX5L6J1_9MICC|nr:APC family permease [Pseudoglutamicibacter cumminsii]PWI28459.1 amino acid permease [Pseudoglutamicibacter cumminsii]
MSSETHRGAAIAANANAPQEGELKKTQKPGWIFAVAVGSAVGWGAFVLPVDWLHQGGIVGAALGMAIGGALIALIALSYGIVIKALPVTGGEVAYALVAFGRRHAFVVGWFLTLGYLCIVALNASAMALVARRLVPGIMEKVHLWTIAGFDVYLPEVIFASACLVLFGWLNIRGAEFGGRVQFIAVIIMLIAVALIVIGVVALAGRNELSFGPAFPTDVPPMAAIITLVAIAPWAFIGFDNVPQVAGEFNFSPRKALGLILFAIFAAVAIYVLMIMAVSLSAGPGIENIGDDTWAPADVIAGVLGQFGVVLLVIGVSMGIFTGLNGFTMSASRVILSLGRARMLPEATAKISPRFHTPHVALVVVVLLCLITPWFGRAALSWVVDMSSVGVTIAYFYTCLCAFKVMHRDRSLLRASGERVPFWMALSGPVALLGALISIMFLLLLFLPFSPGALGKESLIALIAWLVLGVIFFLVRRPRFEALTEEETRDVMLGEHQDVYLDQEHIDEEVERITGAIPIVPMPGADTSDMAPHTAAAAETLAEQEPDDPDPAKPMK